MSQDRPKSRRNSKKIEIASNLKESKSFKTGYLTLTTAQDTSQDVVRPPSQVTFNAIMREKLITLNAATCQSKERKP